MNTGFQFKGLLIGCLLFLLSAGCATQKTQTLEPTATTVPLTTTPLKPSPTPQSLAEELDSHLSFLSERNILRGSVLVAIDAEIILSKGYGLADPDNNIPNTPQTKFRIGSIGEQFTAMGILILQSQGQLNVQDGICKYISACPAVWHDISIHHLLTHTSGIPNVFELEERVDPILTPLQKVELLMEKPLAFKPGEQWDYNYRDSGYLILGYIVERVSGQSYEDFLRENIFEPLQMRDTGLDQKEEILAIGYRYSVPDKDTNLDHVFWHAAGGLYSSVEDMFRWEQAMYTEQLIPQELLDMMFTPHHATSPGGQTSYGYGWYIGEAAHNRRVFMHVGVTWGFQCVIVRFPDDNVTIIVLSNKEAADLGYVVTGIEERVFKE